MIKEYCDICGKEVKTNKYILPEWTDDYTKDKNDTPLLQVSALKPVEKDVCKNCADVIARMIAGYGRCKKTSVETSVIYDDVFMLVRGGKIC